MNTITGVVTHTERIGTSTMGNPTYRVEIRDDSKIDTNEPIYSSHKTMSNAMIGYAITNSEYRDTVHIFTLTTAGNIRSASRA